MKRLLVVLLMAFGLMIPAHTYAQSNPAPSGSVSPSQVMSPEDMAKMRSQLAELSKAMGNPVPADSAKPADAKPADAKPNNMSEVANKALDMVGNAVATLSQSLSKIAPTVWRIMIIQQYAKAADGIITPVLLLCLLGVATVIVRKNIPAPSPWNESWDESDWTPFWVRTIIPLILMCVFGCWFVANIIDSIKLLINPEYYAIKDILMLLTNPSGAVTPGS